MGGGGHLPAITTQLVQKVLQLLRRMGAFRLGATAGVVVLRELAGDEAGAQNPMQVFAGLLGEAGALGFVPADASPLEEPDAGVLSTLM
jgi:hypothetical protein